MKNIVLILILTLSLRMSGQDEYFIKNLTNEKISISAIDISPDDKNIAGLCGDDFVRIWQVSDGKLIKEWNVFDYYSNQLIYSKDGNALLSFNGKNILYYNSLTGEPIKTFDETPDDIVSINFTPDGQHIITRNNDRRLYLWNIETGEQVRAYQWADREFSPIAFDKENKYIITGFKRNLKIWDMASGELAESIAQHTADVTVIETNRETNIIFTGSKDRTVSAWNFDTGKKIVSFKWHSGNVGGIELIFNGKYLLTFAAEKVSLWKVSDGENLYEFEPFSTYISSFCTSGDNSLLFVSASGEHLKVYDLAKMVKEKAGDKIIADVPKSAKETAKDTKAPEIRILYPPITRGFKSLVNKNGVDLSGHISDDSEINSVYLNGQQIQINKDGTFSHRLQVPEEGLLVKITAKDINDNESEKIFTIFQQDDQSSLQAGQTNPSDVITKTGQYHALIIGINAYDDPHINDLDNPVKDAKSLAKVLSEHYTFPEENITMLTNATRRDIVVELDNLGNKLSRNDNLLIFYAGHGYWDDDANIGYWLPSDAAKSTKVDWFRNSTLKDYVKQIPAQHTLLITDACFGGAIFKTRKAFADAPKAFNSLYELPSRKAMTSGTLKEVPDVSVFLKYLIKRLEQNEEKYVSSEQLFSSIRIAVMNNSDNVPQFGVIQKSGDEGGDFIFIRR
jgi:WD40 repeat protein